MTEFPCSFPCPWHNQTFLEYSSRFYEWMFNADGRTSTLYSDIGDIYNIRCHQITERFLIVREEGTDNFRCLSINYNPETPLEFIMEGWSLVRSRPVTGWSEADLSTGADCPQVWSGADLSSGLVKATCPQTTAFTDLCAFCKEPDYPFSWTIATPLPASVGCNRPSSCSPPGEVCSSSETIPKACPTTTASPPTTTDPKTTKSHCGKRQHTRSSP
ncbi:Hypothetical predicted protein [Mytilus galloprovincialis]|uniref:Uncharacterized protein n=1 Tax=Mytilus galloprovincialis TaxID=29158 RepID=A0A8B6CQN8_MYTGA|nr:Hypothetical predicted protein [Mytilus galloprovincialis]